MMNLDFICNSIRNEPFVQYCGRVTKVRRDSVRVFIPNAKVGSMCIAHTKRHPISLEIVSLDPAGHIAMPLDDLSNLQLGD